MATTSNDQRMRPEKRRSPGGESALNAEPPTADDAVLDEIFGRALQAAERGEVFDVTRWLVGRDHLLAAAGETIALAREVAVNVERTPAASVRSVAGYEIVRELGHGAMGAVFLARQTSLGGRLVALKLLPPSAALSDRARSRFVTEARALARIRHVNVVAVHDVVESGDACAYSMEWVEGASLADLLRALKSESSIEQAARTVGLDSDALAAQSATVWICRLGIAIARALGEVHRAGLLHRDVKPSNILLRRDGTPLLSDFGLVRENHSEHVTRTGHYLGTPAYSSPEQLRGEHTSVDARSDVYSLAATLYEALTGRVPHAGRSPAEILARAETGAFAPARKLNRSLPRDLDTILSSALSPNPSRRYSTADDFASDVERLLALQPIRARPQSLGSRVAKWSRRNRRALVPALATTLVVSLAASWLTRHAIERAHADEHALAKLAEAQQALLDPAYADSLFYAANNEPRPSVSSTPGTPSLAARTTQASVLYDAALAFAPAASLAERVSLERDTVRLAAEVALGRGEPSDLLIAHCPLTSDSARRWSAAATVPPWTDSALAAATPDDRRQLGLLAFLLGDARLSIAAWRDASITFPPDALADASLGQLYLEMEQPALAAPRLRSACGAYPEAGFLVVALADALVANAVAAHQLEDLAVAERLLDQAKALPLHNTFDSDIRIRADIAAARGECAKARKLYEWMMLRHQGPTLLQHYAAFLEDRQELEDAVAVMKSAVVGHSHTPGLQQRLTHLADAWWASLPAEPTVTTLRCLLDHPDCSFGSFFDLAATLRNASLNDHPSTRTLLRSPENPDPMPPHRGSSSPTSGRPALHELTARMEINHMDAQFLPDLSAALKDAHAFLWSATPSRATQVMLASMRAVLRSRYGASAPSVSRESILAPTRRNAVFAAITLASAASTANAQANIQTFTDRSTFLTVTNASAEPPFPNVGPIPGGSGALFVHGSLIYTIAAPTSALSVGAAGQGAFGITDWAITTPGNDLALSDVENLNVDLGTPAHALGFDFEEPNGPTATNAQGCGFGWPCIDSTFEVTLRSANAAIASFTYNAPDGTAAFVGVWSDQTFDRVEIREVVNNQPGHADNEFFGRFYLGVTAPPIPFCQHRTYGVPMTNSLGCAPTIHYSGLASAGNAARFDVTATGVINNKPGLLFYGFGPAQQPFQGGYMWVAGPVRRTPVQDSGGSLSLVDCSGTFALNFNAHIQSGNDPALLQGATVYCQYWYRDPASPSTTGLTNALSFSIYP